jgi:hypothetical protein
MHTTSKSEWVRSLFFPLCGFTELTTCSQVLQGSRLESPDDRIYRRFQEPSRPTTGSSLSLHRFERQSPRHEDERSGITAIETKPDWEKTLATQTQKLGDRSKWLESDASLQAVVSAAEDPVLGGIVTKKVESKPNEMRDVQSIKLSELRDELEVIAG